ncbi:hypothetical protein SASPL_132750 [Salvia splendens]|uniref:non-specific serine/threonine protein kinase n=1 Tax=Salvia splendens TaxID=180675 RepID=A0A8X8ZIH0_SALSN|nr:hypothetical protein SASPL_132750 [Salvia splendens]
MRSATGVVYEADNATLGPASYYVTREQRWAVSNVGLPSGSRNPEYITNFVTYIPNTRDPEMYQSSRVSAGSLRYYSSGLENGGYNITLQFGNLAFKDFDIRKEGIYGPSISALSVSPGEFLGLETRPYTFTYAQLRAATDDFSTANKLGEGGFGTVYKGKLEDGRVTAVKLLSVASRQGKSEFLAEIETISAVQHRNLVKLYGCCIEGNKRLLVYEYLENKSLDHQALFGIGSFFLVWHMRFDICLGVARGLAYLHEESRLRIVHRDVKASNILLDTQLNPTQNSRILAWPSLGILLRNMMRGHLTVKADVFGFGVVALEIISGRANSDPNQEEDRVYLLEWV